MIRTWRPPFGSRRIEVVKKVFMHCGDRRRTATMIEVERG
jgi:hypothetical protein